MLYSIKLKKDLQGKGFIMKKLIAMALVAMALGTSAMAYNGENLNVPYHPVYNSDVYHPSNNPADWN